MGTAFTAPLTYLGMSLMSFTKTANCPHFGQYAMQPAPYRRRVTSTVSPQLRHFTSTFSISYHNSDFATYRTDCYPVATINGQKCCYGFSAVFTYNFNMHIATSLLSFLLVRGVLCCWSLVDRSSSDLPLW